MILGNVKVSVYEAKSKLSQMINKALEGEEVIITRNGHDTVRLVRVVSQADWIGMWEGKGRINEGFSVEYELTESQR